MFEHKKIQDLEEYFSSLDKRSEKCVYFYRISVFNEDIKEFIRQYFQGAKGSGIVIEGKIQNPNEGNLNYYEEIIGLDFQLSVGFLAAGLKKWLPRMAEKHRVEMAAAMYDTLDELRRSGKNEDMLKNAFIKFMCWLYYRFERIVMQLGENSPPKVLYEGTISRYELLFLSILSKVGCDIVLLLYQGEGPYLRLDPQSKLSHSYTAAGAVSFPESFNLEKLRAEIEGEMKIERLYGRLPHVKNCTNAWIEGNGFADFLKPYKARGQETDLFYNCFYRINGVEDKLTYAGDLYKFYQQLRSNERNVVVTEKEIPLPTNGEIAEIRRKNYTDKEQGLLDLSSNIQYPKNSEMKSLMIKAFMDIMLVDIKDLNCSLNRFLNRAVYLLCWIKRYQSKLFPNWKMPEVATFIHMGGCKDETEALFFKLLAKLPVDVLILRPDLNAACCLADKFLYDVNFNESLELYKFPDEEGEIYIGTAAYHAERELDTILYGDSGMYRVRQHDKAMAVTLQTTYDEIGILWDQELKYRPSFDVIGDTVTMPVIFAKISGVKGKQVTQYWADIKKLKTDEAFLVKDSISMLSPSVNPMKAYAVELLKNGKLQKGKIKEHRAYQYGVLREKIQDYMLEKLQLLLDLRSIKGTFENGTEYTIVATALNLDKSILRMIQSFDFTKKNPKLIYINTTEKMISLEDSITMAFLNLIGFDVICFIPTGYRNIEKYFNGKSAEEHQIGEYVYDLQVPDFDTFSLNVRQGWREKIFRRGN